MKKIKLNNKLQLKKETIARLNNSQLNSLKGGTIGPATAQAATCGTVLKCCLTDRPTVTDCASATCTTG